MSKKGTIEVFQTKISRNDRFAQMSHQEKLIEQKKREIQAKLEQKRASKETENVKSSTTKSSSSSSNKSLVKISTTDKNEKKAFSFNTFSNDGSFLNQFKQMKEKKLDHKSKSFNNNKQGNERDNDRNSKNKWKKEQTSPTISKDNHRNQKSKPSRFNHSEPKISITTSYSNLITQHFEAGVVTAQDVTGQPLLKNLVTVTTSQQQYPPNTTNVPIMMNVPPPQIQLHALPPEITVDTVITTVALSQETSTIINVPPPCLPPLELASIPPPNPIQVHNIPQPEPMNTLTIPPPAPLQVQNIPPPSPIQLNEIPNPKSLDLLAIPTPNEEPDAEFIKNVPPPNKSVPPPSIADNVPTCLPPPNVMPPTSMPPPQAANLNLLVAQVPTQVAQVTQIQLQQLPPPPAVVPIVTQPVPQPIMNPIPALMAQPILPPVAMGIVPPPQINVPPPTMMQQTQIQLPPPSVFNQQAAMIPVNVPPPLLGLTKDVNTGSADYEAMASLGRMVAQCGPGIEDVVRQRKNQDPSLWFLFNTNSAAYRQYQQMVDQFKAEMSVGVERCDQDQDYKPEEIYESDTMDDCDMNDATGGGSQYSANKRKRKSRWGEKIGVPPPILQTPILPSSTGVMLSKITRQDPGFINYVISTYGSTNVNEETWIKAEDNYKVHLVYQEMLKKKQDLERMQITGRKKYDYDSDEETDGGTWEHKQRESEMKTTQQWAQELTRHADGKHHIGDFLPPEEFKKLFQSVSDNKDATAGGGLDPSDYSEHKLREDNKGFKMLQKLGWSEGKGLGTTEKGILEPINKGFVSRDGLGLGNQQDNGGNNEGNGAEDEYDAYRKRMMLAYKFRPNPLNNPRRAYY